MSDHEETLNNDPELFESKKIYQNQRKDLYFQ